MLGNRTIFCENLNYSDVILLGFPGLGKKWREIRMKCLIGRVFFWGHENVL
jgi:hypothetical protein